MTIAMLAMTLVGLAMTGADAQLVPGAAPILTVTAALLALLVAHETMRRFRRGS